MVDQLARNWGWLALRGAATLAFGLLALFWPQVGLVTLLFLFGVFVLADGITAIISAIANRREGFSWGGLLLGGIAAIVIGVLVFVMPDITALVLLYLIAAWALISGIGDVVSATRLRKYIENEWLLVLTGLLKLAFAVLLFVSPGAGALALILWIGIFAVITGVLMLAFAFRLRRWQREHPGESSMRRAA